MNKTELIEKLDLMYVDYYENNISKNDLIVRIRRLRDELMEESQQSEPMSAKEYLKDIGLEKVIDEEFFNDDDKSWYKVQELMEEYAKLKG